MKYESKWISDRVSTKLNHHNQNIMAMTLLTLKALNLITSDSLKVILIEYVSPSYVS